MNSINRLNSNTVSIAKSITKTSEASKVKLGKTQLAASNNRLKLLSRIHERPKLISEICTTNSSCSAIQLGQSVLKDILVCLLAIKAVLEANTNDLSELNHLDRLKRDVKRLVNTKHNNEFVLDSNFRPIQSPVQFIDFTIEGLNLNRLRLHDEVVSVYLANKLLPLVFSRLDSDEEHLKRFKRMVGLSGMKINSVDGQLVFSANDLDWRKWDQIAKVSGQGARFPNDVAIEIQAKSSIPSVEEIYRLDTKLPKQEQIVNKAIDHIKSIYADSQTDLETLKFKGEELTQLCAQKSADESEKVKEAFQSGSRKISLDVKRHFIDITRSNIEQLLEPT